MKTEKRDLEKSQIQINFELEHKEVEPYLKKAATRLSEKTKIEGFRPGKASFDVVKQKLGDMAIYEEALDEIIKKTLFKYIEKENLAVIGQPNIDVEKIAPGNPLSYKATLTLLPKVKLCDYKNDVKLERNEIKVDEARAEKVLKDFQKMYAKEKLVEREARAGDRVEVDIDMFINKVAVTEGSAKKQSLLLGDNLFVKGFDEQIFGMKKDKAKEFKLKFPKEHYRKDLVDKEVEFKVKLLSVFERELPKIDDEFAKQLGAKSLEELKGQVKADLLREAETKQEQTLETEMLKKLTEKSTFDPIPDLLVNSEVDKMIEELKIGVMQQGIAFEDYLTSINKKAEDLKLDFAGQALDRVKSALLTREISKHESIKVEEAEINAEIEKYLQVYGQNEQERKTIESSEYKDYLKNVIANRKVIQLLKEIIIK